MSEGHLSEIELLELVEGELREAEEAAARAHLATCRTCAESVASLERARVALRAAPVLELSEQRFREMVDALPRRERERPAWLEALRNPRRLMVVAAPAAVVVAVVAIAVSLGDGGGDDESAAPAAAPAEVAQDLQADAQAEAAAGEAPPPAEPSAEPPAEAAVEEAAARDVIRTVQGVPEQIAALLTRQGLDARVVDGTVEVHGADPAAVAEVLEDLPDGDVEVVVVPAP